MPTVRSAHLRRGRRLGRPEYADQTAEYGEFGAAAETVIRGVPRCQPTSTATTVSVNGGKGGDIVTTDGPFAETKEVLGGFYLLEAPTSTRRDQVGRADPGRVARPDRGPPRARDGTTERIWPTLHPWQGGQALATLTRLFGDLQLAEDAVQDAVVVALERWPVDGTPTDPPPGSRSTARNKALDRLRREGRRSEKERRP